MLSSVGTDSRVEAVAVPDLTLPPVGAVVMDGESPVLVAVDPARVDTAVVAVPRESPTVSCRPPRTAPETASPQTNANKNTTSNREKSEGGLFGRRTA